MTCIHTYIIFLLDALLESLPLLVHGVLVFHLSRLGIQLGVIEEALWEVGFTATTFTAATSEMIAT